MILDSPPPALQNVFLMVLRLQPLRHIALGVWDSPISNEWNINPDVLRVCSLSRMENSLRD